MVGGRSPSDYVNAGNQSGNTMTAGGGFMGNPYAYHDGSMVGGRSPSDYVNAANSIRQSFPNNFQPRQTQPYGNQFGGWGGAMQPRYGMGGYGSFWGFGGFNPYGGGYGMGGYGMSPYGGYGMGYGASSRGYGVSSPYGGMGGYSPYGGFGGMFGGYGQNNQFWWPSNSGGYGGPM